MPERSSCRHSAFQWVRIVPLFSPTFFCNHTKRTSYNLCFQRDRNNISVQSNLQVHRWCIVHKQPEFENYLGQTYPAEPEIKDTMGNTTSASYLDLLLSTGRDGQLHTSIYDKQDDFNFHITNFPSLSSNIPSSTVYDVLISQLIRYARACPSYKCFMLRTRRLSSKLRKKGYLVNAWNRHSGSFMADTGILLNNMKSPSREF